MQYRHHDAEGSEVPGSPGVHDAAIRAANRDPKVGERLGNERLASGDRRDLHGDKIAPRDVDPGGATRCLTVRIWPNLKLPRYKGFAPLPLICSASSLSKGQTTSGFDVRDGTTAAIAVGKLLMPPRGIVAALDQRQLPTEVTADAVRKYVLAVIRMLPARHRRPTAR